MRELAIVVSRAILVPLLLALGAQVGARSAPNVVAWDGNGIVQTNVPSNLTNAVAVSAGYQHALALRADGTVVAWGDNSAGQTNVPAGLSNVVAIAAAGFHNLALRTDGTVVAWGTNFHGESTVPSGLDQVVGIAAGFYHNLALRADGTVVAWGTNYWGSLTVDFGESKVPPGLNNVVAIAAGDAHSAVLRADGTVVSWGAYPGLEYWYPFGTPSGLSNIVAIAAGDDYGLALKADGTVTVWRDPQYGQQAGLTNVTAIAAGRGGHRLALRADGSVVAFPPASQVPSGLSNVVAIADGAYSLAVIGSGPPAPGPPLVERAVAQGAGTAIFYAPAAGAWPLSYQWRCNGTNLPNATNAWLVLTTPPPIDAGLYSVSVSNSWGTSTTRAGRLNVEPAIFPQPPLDQVGYLGGTATFSMEAQASPPASFQWRFNDKDLAGETNSALVLSNLTRASQGSYSVVVSNQFGWTLSPAARLWVVNVAGWGNNSWWRSDITFAIYGGQAVAPAGLSNAVAVSAGEAHSLALRDDGTVVAWGNNLEGETNVPPGLSNVVAIGSGPYHNLALKRDGTVFAWGLDNVGQAEIPAGLSNVVAVAAGGSHSLALRADGTVIAWGANDYGQTDVPSGLSNVVAIAAGNSHSLALRADGTLAAWGQYEHWVGAPPWDQMLPIEVPIWPGPPSAPPQPFTRIGSGASHCLAVWDQNWPPWEWYWNGNPVAWGENRYGQTTVPFAVYFPTRPSTQVVAVDGGDMHSLALFADGSVVAWGENSYAQTNVPADLHNAIAIAAGGLHNLALIGEAPPVLLVPLSNPGMNNGLFTVVLPSQSGRVYALQYKNSLEDSSWGTLPLVAGNGGTLTLSDPTAAKSAARYYRVLQW